jgi:hypothetical protein
MSYRIYLRATMMTLVVWTAGVAAQAPAPVDVCSLLTVQEASTAVGETVKDGKGGTAGGGRSVMPNTAVSFCEWASATSLHSVHINVWRSAGPTQMQQMGTMVCSKKTKDGLEGLGDVACWYDTKHEELQVYKGPIFLSVEMRRSSNLTEAIKTVARTALGRVK